MDSKPKLQHLSLINALPTVFTTLYLLALLMLNHRQLPALELIHKSYGSDLPWLFVLIKVAGFGVYIAFTLTGIGILLLIHYRQRLGLVVSSLWLVFSFGLSWLLLAMHSSAWAAISPDGSFPVGSLW